MDEVVSDIIIRTTEIDPKTNLLALFALEAQLGTATEIGDGYEHIVIGSVADLNIRPLLRCDNDINIMSRSNGEIAIPIGCKIPDDDYLRRFNRTNICLYRMQPTQDPRYVCLLTAGYLQSVPHSNPARFIYKPDTNSGIYVQKHKGSLKLTDFITVESATRRTFHYCGSIRMNSLKMHELQLVISSDSAKSIPCPNWSSDDFCQRLRPNDWPTKDMVTEIVRNGCDLFLASGVKAKNASNTAQWRLSFPRAETLLMETWNPVQKIVYHLLRYLRRKCLPVAGLISNYDLKTMMLWNCEKRPHSYWTANVVTISCDLLGRLLRHVNERYLPNYFIPQSNVFEVRTDEGDSFESRYAAVATMLKPLMRADTLAKWFLVNYIGDASKRYHGSKSESMAEGLVLIDHLDTAELMSWLTVFIDTFLADYCKQRSMEVRSDVNNCMNRLLALCAAGKLDPKSCKHIFDQLHRFDIRSLDFFRSIIFMEAANQTDQFGISLGGDSIGMVIAVLLRSGKISHSAFHHCEGDSALSYFKIATALLTFVRYPTEEEDKLLLALSKAYFWKSLLCTDARSVYCAANAYLAAIFYQGKETKLALHCCTLIASKEEHLACSGYTMQPELLPIVSTILSDYFETGQESKNVSHRAAGKNASIDTLTPEILANCLLSEIYMDNESNRFYEDEDKGSSGSRMTSRRKSDKNISYSQASTDEAKTPSYSSSHFASRKILLKDVNCEISSDISQETLCKSGKTDSLACNHSLSDSVYTHVVDYCMATHKSELDERCFVFDKCRPADKSEKLQSTDKHKNPNTGEYERTRGNISAKTRIYVRTECYENCQKREIVESQYRGHCETSFKSKADTHLENNPIVAKPNKIEKEMVYCCEQSNLDMSIPFAIRNQKHIDHKPVDHSNSCRIKYVIYSRTDSDVYPRPEDDEVPAALKLTAKNVSDSNNYETFLEQNSRNTCCTDFDNAETISDKRSSRKDYSNCQHVSESIATSVRQDVVRALVKASVCQMTTFNEALQNDPDISEHGNCYNPYMALHHFNSGQFQAALLICNDILKPGKVHSSDATCFNVICSPPFNLLLTHELKIVVNECRSSSEITTIDARFLAVYLSIHCLMNLNRSVVEIAGMLMTAYGLLLRPHEAFQEVNSGLYVLLKENVLHSYRGIITENTGKNSLSVRENGTLTNVRIRHNGGHIELHTVRHGASDKENLFSYVDENFNY